MKNFKRKATCISIAASMCLGSLSYGVVDGSNESLIENSIKAMEVENSNRDIFDWTPPEINSSKWAIDELYDARVYNLITYSLARNVQKNMNRADAAELGVQLYERLSGKRISGELENPFIDTDNRSILKAYKLGIVRGVAEDRYAPEQDVSRQDLSVILFNAINAYEENKREYDKITGFKDKEDISGYAVKPMRYMISNGFIRGRTSDTIQPRANTKKEEALVIAKRMYEVIRDEKGESSKGLFYKVSDKEGNELYLLGSIHIAKQEAYPLMKSIREAFLKSDIVSLEVDVADGAKVSDEVLAQVFYRDGRSLKDDISEELYAELEETLKDYNLISMADIENYKPWYLNIVLPMLVGMEDIIEEEWNTEIDPENMSKEELEELENAPYRYTPGIDKYFAERAYNRGKKVKEIEGVDYQLNMYRNMSMETQEELLKMTVRDIVEGNIKEDATLDVMMDIWRNSDEEGLRAIIESSMEGMPDEYNEVLRHIRNREMSEKIKEYMKDENSYFVVVGAGHLVGETSIVNELKKSGYKVNKLD